MFSIFGIEISLTFLLILCGLIVLGVLFSILSRYQRKKHDRNLERAVLHETTVVPSVQTSSVSVAFQSSQEENLDDVKKGIFMPVPDRVLTVIDFLKEGGQPWEIYPEISADEVNQLMTNETASRNVSAMHCGKKTPGETAIVYLDLLSDEFEAYSYINLDILKQYGVIAKTVQHLIIHSRGTLKKPLMIEADEFSAEAVKMLLLTGGRAIMILSAE